MYKLQKKTIFCRIVSFLIPSVIVAFAFTMLVAVPTICFFGEYKLFDKADIVSIKTNSQTSGSFILGCGTINNNEYYIYMEKINGNTFIRNKCRVSRTFIVETNCLPHIEHFRKMGNKYFFCFPIIGNELYYIYVPKNTIVRGFEIK